MKIWPDEVADVFVDFSQGREVKQVAEGSLLSTVENAEGTEKAQRIGDDIFGLRQRAVPRFPAPSIKFEFVFGRHERPQHSLRDGEIGVERSATPFHRPRDLFNSFRQTSVNKMGLGIFIFA